MHLFSNYMELQMSKCGKNVSDTQLMIHVSLFCSNPCDILRSHGVLRINKWSLTEQTHSNRYYWFGTEFHNGTYNYKKAIFDTHVTLQYYFPR